MAWTIKSNGYVTTCLEPLTGTTRLTPRIDRAFLSSGSSRTILIRGNGSDRIDIGPRDIQNRKEPRLSNTPARKDTFWGDRNADI